jgi:group I intron endonuclease
MKKIGIYKITSPSGKVYIGQSADIEYRFNDYKRLRCKAQAKLYASFKKHGVENHTFEVIKECEVNELNYYERHYQEFYDVLDRDLGLNLKYTSVGDKKVVHSEETIQKIRQASIGNKNNLGRKHSEESKRKNSESKKKLYANGLPNPASKKVINTETNDVYISLSQMCRILNISINTMKPKLCGLRNNNTPFRYL